MCLTIVVIYRASLSIDPLSYNKC